MTQNPLRELPSLGQSIWLDFLRKGMLRSGELRTLIEGDGLLGVTTNPSIFEKAILGSPDYDADICAASLSGKTSKEIYASLTLADIQAAADLFRKSFERTKGRDGFVSLEVSPHLSYDTEGTIAEARELWKAVSRPNVLIKVPGTAQGIPAIRTLIQDGINVNVTLLFSLERADAAAEAYLAGLEARVAEGKAIGGIASVASFFLSRIDVAVDALLPAGAPLRGRTAIATAKLAYQRYQVIFGSERFQALARKGAATQRLLWASTGTKNPVESDVKYVEALIGPDTVNTLPLETLNAYRDHGEPMARLETGLEPARETLAALEKLGIDLPKVSQRLEDEGVHKFRVAFDQLLSALEVKREGFRSDAPKREGNSLVGLGAGLQRRVRQLEDEHASERIWRKDPSLWKDDSTSQAGIRKSLGWLHIAEKMRTELGNGLTAFAEEVQAAGFKQVVHMGMGGSSLAARVFSLTWPRHGSLGGLPVSILDSTDPSVIRGIESQCNPADTLFIVASKSGTTAEPLAFRDYFFERVRSVRGDRAGESFVAITDPDTPLAREAERLKYRRVFLGAPDIGGRYSALSYFGLVPAALMGVNLKEVLDRAWVAAHGSMACVPCHEAPALLLGAALGEMGVSGKDKLTLLVEKPVEALGPWVEQLIAESTGKEGRGLIPICDEPLGETSAYGSDRLFVHVKFARQEEGDGSEELRSFVSNLKEAGHPVVTLEMADRSDVGEEFFRWEFATAVAGSILGINPFDQPNVQESKDCTDRQLFKEEAPERPSLREGRLSFFGNLNAGSAAELLTKFLGSAKKGNYVALQAFLPETPDTHRRLQSVRRELRDRLRLATTLGYGPRFLHSTGQLHKGGPATGLFLQLTADPVSDLAIPGRPYTFGRFEQAQAQGDLEALRRHGRRVMRVHLGSDVEAGLRELESLASSAVREGL